MAVLVWEAASGRVEFGLDRGVLVLGRDPSADIQIDDATVSRRHALVQVENGRVTVTDLGSKGHTKINGAGLTRDMPSTLESGDLLQLGAVVLTLEAGAGPPAPAPAPLNQASPSVPAVTRQLPKKPVRPRRKPAPAAPSERKGPWMWIAVGLGAVLLIVVGVLIGVLAGKDEKETSGTDGDASGASADGSRSESGSGSGMKIKTAGPVKKKRERAARGELPPRHGVSVADCPDLVEIDGAQYYPLEVLDWTSRVVEGVGGDGRIYSFARGLVTKVEDRADLRARVRARRGQLPQDDADARAQLAKWCANRLLAREAGELVAEALALDPRHADAQLLKDWLERNDK